jgi:hypothetical protein
MRRDRGGVFYRHCEERSDEAIHRAARKKAGLLRFARNDDLRNGPPPSNLFVRQRASGRRRGWRTTPPLIRTATPADQLSSSLQRKILI